MIKGNATTPHRLLDAYRRLRKAARAVDAGQPGATEDLSDALCALEVAESKQARQEAWQRDHARLVAMALIREELREQAIRSLEAHGVEVTEEAIAAVVTPLSGVMQMRELDRELLRDLLHAVEGDCAVYLEHAVTVAYEDGEVPRPSAECDCPACQERAAADGVGQDHQRGVL